MRMNKSSYPSVVQLVQSTCLINRNVLVQIQPLGPLSEVNMNWFKKKQNPETVLEETIASIIPKECQHIWWDSSPFFEFSWNAYQSEYNRKKDKKEQLGRLRIEITESYVCCNCGERHNEILQKIEIEDITRDQALEEVHKTKEEYKIEHESIIDFMDENLE